MLHQAAPIVVPAGAMTRPDTAIADAVVFDHVWFAFDDLVVLRDVSFSIPAGRMRILLGASGSGKSVLLKLILGLFRPDSGAIYVKGQRIDTKRERDQVHVRADIGMLFQENALFDSLTVADNVGYRLYEETDMPWDEVRRRAEEPRATFMVLHDGRIAFAGTGAELLASPDPHLREFLYKTLPPW
jgi:phospholipid/cholesterol/gamma-HCH transport system ATP-binding protein